MKRKYKDNRKSKKTGFGIVLILLSSISVIFSLYIVGSLISENSISSPSFYVAYDINGVYQTISDPIIISGVVSKGGVNYDYTINSSLYKAYFRNNSNSVKAMRFEKDGYFVSWDFSTAQLRWISKPGQPVISETLGGGVPSNSQDTQIIINNLTANYPGGFSNTNITFKFEPNQIKENLVLSYLPSIKDYEYLKYDFHLFFNSTLKICANGICYIPSGTQDNFNTTGRIEFKDSNNKTRYYISEPIIRASNGNTTKGIMFIKGSNAQMDGELRIPTIFIQNNCLSNASGVYCSISFDPTVVSQEIQTVLFSPDGKDNITAQLFKNTSNGFSASEGAWVRIDEEKYKFGADDIYNTGLEQYKYEITTTGKDIENYGSRFKFDNYFLEPYDICGKENASCQYNVNGKTMSIVFWSNGTIDPILTGDSSYNATLNGNITQETGYVHLNLSTSSPYDTLKNYWSFDKDTTTAFDWQVPGNDLTYGSGSTNLQNGLYNDYANISATSGTNLATGTGLLDDTSGSLSIWLYPAALTGGATAIGALTSVRFGLLLEGNKISAQRYISSYQGIDTTSTISANQWYHVVVVFTSGGDIQNLYLNGVNQTGAVVGQSLTGTTGFEIGGYYGSASFNWEGKIDEVMIFTSQLTQQQVTDIYNNQSARFKSAGEMLFKNINLGTNTTANVTIAACEVTLNSNISVKFNSGSYQYFKNCNADGYSLSGLGDITNLNMTIRLEVGNGSTVPATNSYYSPIVAGNITVNGYTSDLPPSVFLISPSNNTKTTQSLNYFVANHTDDLGLIGTNLTIRNSTGSIIGINNTAITGTSNTTNLSFTLPYNDIFKWNYNTFDNGGFNSWNATNYTITYDNINPSVTILNEYPSDPQTYSSGATYKFNATVTDNLVGVGTVLLNFSGVLYSTTQNSNVFNKTFVDLTAGTYNYNWVANDTIGNLNASESGTYTINKAVPSGSVSLAPSATVTYPTSTTATGSESNVGDGDLTYTLFRDGIAVSNPEIITLGVGVYNYTYNVTSGQNYSAVLSLDSKLLTVNQGTGVVATYINNSRANITIEVGTSLLLNSSLLTGQFGSLNLTQDGVQLNYSITNNLTYTQLFNTIGTFNIKTNYSGNTNYTSAIESWNVTVRDTTNPIINLLLPSNGSAVSPLVYFYANNTDNYALKNTTLYLWNSTGSLINTNFTTLTGTSNTANLSLTLPYLGTFFWNYNTFDTSNNNAWNNTNFTITYSDATKPLIQFVPVTETNNTNLNRNNILINVTATDETSLASIVINVYNTTGLFYTNTSATSPLYVNVTSMPDGRYYFNATATDSATNTNSTETRTVLIDTTKPLIQYVSPTETAGAYLNRSSILINVTSTDTNLVNITINLYNSTSLVNSTTTLTSPNYINVTSLPEGLYFFNATSIDIAGNVNNTVTRNVTIDTTYPLIDWGIGTLPDYSNASQSNVYLNTTWTEINPSTVTFWVNGISHINSIPPNVYADNYTGLADGTMTYYVVICDLANQCNQTSTRTITLDTTRPLIQFVNPTQNSGVNLSRNYIEANVTINETNFKNITFNLYNTTSLVNSTIYSTQTLYLNWSSLPNGIYTYNVTVLDIVGLSNSTETRTITLDTTSPIVNLIAPSNNTKSTLATHSFNSTFTDNIALVNATLYLWNSTNSLINTTTQSKSGTSGGMNLSVTLPYNDIFKWNYYVCDTTSCAFNITNFTITYDNTNPSASYVLPTHNSSIVLYTNKIKVNVSANDSIQLDTITIRLYNGSHSLLYTNYSTSSPFYIEYPNLNANGNRYFFNATANDTLNNLVNLATRNVTLDTTPINFTNPLNDSSHTAGVFSTTAETLNGETATWVYRFLTSWITPSGNPQSSFTDAQTIASGTYNWTVNATDTEGNIVQWIEYDVVFSSAGGGAYTCDIRASATRTSASSVLISVATLGSTGTPENHALTTNCYDGNGTNITSPTFTNLRTGYYQANFTNNGSGSCDIRDSGASCGHTTIAWTDYGASTTTSSGSSSSGGSSGYLPTPFVTDSYLCNRTYGYISEHGQFDKTNILQLINEMNDETYRLYDIDITEEYIDDWQNKCSDVIMRTLEPDYVCQQTYSFLKSNPTGFTAEKVIELRDKIRNEKTVKLSYSLMANYLNNYNELCFVKGYSPIVKATELKSPILFASASGLESCSIDFIAEDWYIPITRINMNLDSCTSINLYKMLFKLQNGGADSIDIIGLRIVTFIPLALIFIVLLILAIIKYRVENIRGFNLFSHRKKKKQEENKEGKINPPEYKSVEYDTY